MTPQWNKAGRAVLWNPWIVITSHVRAATKSERSECGMPAFISVVFLIGVGGQAAVLADAAGDQAADFGEGERSFR